jgi:molybdate transport system substrate-binding protein
MMGIWTRAALGAALISTLALGETVLAAEVTILANQGAVSAVRDLAPAFEKASGHKVVVIFAAGPAMPRAIDSDAPADLVSQFADAFDELIKRGKVVPGSPAIYARAGNGVAVKAGASKPDISTAEAFKQAMLNAKSIGYSRSGSGMLAVKLMERLGLAEQLKAKTKYIEGRPVAEAVAAGEVEIGLQQTNVIQPVAGTDYVGPLPPELQDYVVFSVGLLTVSKNQDAARAFITFMTAPENAALIRKSGMEPPAK